MSRFDNVALSGYSKKGGWHLHDPSSHPIVTNSWNPAGLPLATSQAETKSQKHICVHAKKTG